jgi:hypothetical protein
MRAGNADLGCVLGGRRVSNSGAAEVGRVPFFRVMGNFVDSIVDSGWIYVFFSSN